MTKQIKNDYDALVEALRLSITAPDDDKAQECIEIAESIASNLTELEVARAKKEASAGGINTFFDMIANIDISKINHKTFTKQVDKIIKDSPSSLIIQLKKSSEILDLDNVFDVIKSIAIEPYDNVEYKQIINEIATLYNPHD